MKEKNEYKFGELPDIFIQSKPNTHTKMDRGFKADNTKINIGASMMKEDEHPLRLKRYENIIDTIKVLWNGLPDEYRDYVKELQIHNVRGYHTGRSGTYTTSRDMKLKGSQVLTMRVRNEDKRADLIHTFLHEIGHSIWHNKLEKQPEKIKQFREGVDELIKSSGGITPYVQEDHVGMQKVLEIFQEQHIRNWRKNRIDSWDMSGEDIEKMVVYQKQQLQQIVSNETHSEALSFILGGVTKWELGKDVKVDTMKKYFKLVEELHK